MKSGSHLGQIGVNETLVLLHTLKQIVDNYVSAASEDNFHASPFWLPLLDETCVVCTATRLEFQEGSRNQTRPYHGTSLPHVHMLIWVDARVHESNIASCARADLGSDLLQTAVERQQRSTVDKVPMRSECTCWVYSEAGWSLKLTHPPDVATLCIQPYLEAVCRAHMGHQCFLTVDSSAHVIKYSTRWTSTRPKVLKAYHKSGFR